MLESCAYKHYTIFDSTVSSGITQSCKLILRLVWRSMSSVCDNGCENLTYGACIALKSTQTPILV